MIAVPPTDLIDIGANLTHESFAQDLPEVLSRATAAGVTRLIVTGTSLESTAAAIGLHDSHRGQLYATAGVHPHHAAEMNSDTLQQLEKLVAHEAVVAVGECGLDYYRNYAPREAQIYAFRRQLELAARVQKPVFLHQRDAHADFMAILREYRPHLRDAVAHCFTGSASELDDCLQLELAIGITGWICDERRGLHLVPMVSTIPAERLMVETDSPYLLPRSIKPKPATRRNEPANLVEIVRAVAAARQESCDAVAMISTQNAVRFFGLDHP
jgi:TatD DNase family protein